MKGRGQDIREKKRFGEKGGDRNTEGSEIVQWEVGLRRQGGVKGEKENAEAGGVGGDEGLCRREEMRQEGKGLGLGSRPR